MFKLAINYIANGHQINNLLSRYSVGYGGIVTRLVIQKPKLMGFKSHHGSWQNLNLINNLELKC